MSKIEELDDMLGFGVEHKFTPDEVITMQKSELAALVMTIEVGLQVVLNAKKKFGENPEIACEAMDCVTNGLLKTMREIMEKEIKSHGTIVDTGHQTLN